MIEDENVISTLTESMKSDEDLNPVIELRVMLLCNISHNGKGCLRLLGLGTKLEGFALYKLIDLFVFRENRFSRPFLTLQRGQRSLLVGGTSSDERNAGSLFGECFLTVWKLAEGRRIVLDPKKNIFPLFLPFLKDENLRRRRGIAGMVK